MSRNSLNEEEGSVKNLQESIWPLQTIKDMRTP